MRSITAVTVARSDYGILRPVLQQIQQSGTLRLRVIVGGMHLADEFGMTVKEVEADGFPISDRVDMLLASDSAEGQAKSMGLGTIGFAQAYARERPDILLVLGDRAEMHAAVVAALPFGIPIAHIHGGEVSLGAIDDQFRHSITKMSHLHFVATEPYARRVRQMGEEPWRVIVSGAPGLDNLHTVPRLSDSELARRISLKLQPGMFLITFHPATKEADQAVPQIRELLTALSAFPNPMVFTKPNADVGGRAILQELQSFVSQRPDAVLVDNLGTQAYFSLMARSAVMIGNSSSGLIEAPSFQLPVVNIGSRQQGRTRAANVIDCEPVATSIRDAIERSLAPSFRASLAGLVNPFGSGHASEQIARTLAAVEINDRLLRKGFHDEGAA